MNLNDWLKRERAMLSYVTPGPWIDDGYRVTADGKLIFEYKHIDACNWNDGPFIANARTSLPEALDIIERLQKQLEIARESMRSSRRIFNAHRFHSAIIEIDEAHEQINALERMK